ncbi:MAG: ABC transporter substrate-binding protein [Rhodobacteraceae bacterium]|nr:ABC transporter substrate-binding protein [Paracoccaceae bacterium]
MTLFAPRQVALATLIATLPAGAMAESHGVTVSHGYTNFGELKYPADFPHLNYVNPDAPKGGQLSLWAQGNFDSFNLYTRKGVPVANTDLMYEDLMIAFADDPYGYYCNLCTTVEYPEGLDWVVINLREDVRFSDGTPMTAEDLKFTIDLFLEQGITEFRSLLDGFFKSIEVTGTHQVRFEFNEAAPLRDRMGLVGLWNPFSKKWFEDNGVRLDESASVPFMGTGPYVVGDVDIGRSITYKKNPDWWGADLPVNKGRFNFDEVRTEYFADSAAAFEAFKAGEYLFRIESSSKDWATSYDFPALNDGHVIQETLPDGSISAAAGFIFNLRRERWKNPQVREMVTMLFNFEWSNESLFYGLYQRPYSFWGNSDLAAEGVPAGDEAALLQGLVDDGLLDASILSDEAWVPPVNDAAKNNPSRSILRAANRLLDGEGWEVGDDGLRRNAAGETLDLVIIQRSPLFDRIVNPFVENLRLAGINASLERIDTAQYIERRRRGDWDLTNQNPGQGFEPSLGLKQWFHSSTAEDSSRNLMALEDPAIDRLIDVVIEAETLEAMKTGTRALDRVLRAHGFWLPQWENTSHWVAYWDQYRHPEELPPLALGVVDFWWYDAAAAAELRASGALR